MYVFIPTYHKQDDQLGQNQTLVSQTQALLEELNNIDTRLAGIENRLNTSTHPGDLESLNKQVSAGPLSARNAS